MTGVQTCALPISDEIAAWRYVTPEALTREIAANGDRFTPWLKMEWQRICEEFLGDILAGISGGIMKNRG